MKEQSSLKKYAQNVVCDVQKERKLTIIVAIATEERARV